MIVALTTFIGRFRREKCPACLQKGLRQVSVVRAETVVNGEPVPDYRAYLLCDHCKSRFKKHNRILSGVPEDEMPEATRFG